MIKALIVNTLVDGRKLAVALLATAGFLLLLPLGCREIDVPYVVDADEIKRYLNSSEDALDLFRSKGLVVSGTYSLVPGGATYADTVLASKRLYDVWVSDTAWHMGSYGSFRVAEAIVRDEFTVRTKRKLNNDSTVTTQTRRLERLGVFWKLGNDADPYVGWKLWGVNGETATSAAISIKTVSGTYQLAQLYKPGDSTRLGERYMRIREGMPSTVPGGKLGLTVSISVRSNPLLSSVSNSGYYTTPIPAGDSGRFTIDILLPTAYDPLYDVALIQFIGDSLGTIKANPVFIPYKVLH